MSSQLSPLEPRWHVLPGQTSRISTTLGTAFVTLTYDPEEEPFEVFLNVGKAGSETYASAEALGRLISLALRLNSPVSRNERVRDIASQLEHIGSTDRGGSLPSIPDALAKVLIESLAEAAPDEKPHPTSPGPALLAATSPRSLPAMNFKNLSPKRNKQKKPMETNYSLPVEILTAAEQLAAAILRAAPIAAYKEAKARLDADNQARELMERYLTTQSDLRVRQSRNAVTQADVDQLRALQREVQSNRKIVDYAETQQAAIAYLPTVNQEISQLIGVDFASLAGPASC